jgi:hypothetical protein
MKNNDFDFGSFCFGAFLGMFVFSMGLCIFDLTPAQMEKNARKEAIAHGAAHYEVDTNGVVSFKWNK